MNTLRNVPRSDALSHLGDTDTVFVRLALSSNDSSEMVLRSLVVDVPPQHWLEPEDTSLTAPWNEARRVVDSPQTILFCGWMPSETEYEKLYARLTGQMFEVKPQLGKIRPVRQMEE